MDLAQLLHVGRLRSSVPHPDRMGLKEQLIRGLWLTQARGREEYGMRGEPAGGRGRCVLSWGSCPWLTGPWQWRAAQALGRAGVESDLCLHTGFLAAAAAALASHAHRWGPR